MDRNKREKKEKKKMYGFSVFIKPAGNITTYHSYIFQKPLSEVNTYTIF